MEKNNQMQVVPAKKNWN